MAAAFWQIRTDRQARLAREQQDRDDRHREQARLISAVLGPVERPPSQELGKPSVQQGRTAVDLINSSAEPVYRVVAGSSAFRARSRERSKTGLRYANVCSLSREFPNQYLPRRRVSCRAAPTGFGSAVSAGGESYQVGVRLRLHLQIAQGPTGFGAPTGSWKNYLRTRSLTTSGSARMTFKRLSGCPSLFRHYCATVCLEDRGPVCAGLLVRRSAGIVACPRVAVRYPESLIDRARSGHDESC